MYMGYSFIPHLNKVFIKLIISCESFVSFYFYQHGVVNIFISELTPYQS
jgi:hypothetical protein